MAGKRQKPPDQLAGRGSRYRGTSPLALVPADERREVPDMPAGLTVKVARAWDDYWSDPVSQLARPLDFYDIRHYFLLLAERERVERKFDKEPLTKGSAGQDVVNPLLYRLKQLDQEIHRYRQDLGILPLNRMRLGIAHTTAHATFADLMRRSLERDLNDGAEEVPADVVAEWFTDGERRPVIDLDALMREGTEGEPD